MVPQGDTLRRGLLPPLRGEREAWSAPRACDYPIPAFPPYTVRPPHTWSSVYGAYISLRAYVHEVSCQDALDVHGEMEIKIEIEIKMEIEIEIEIT